MSRVWRDYEWHRRPFEPEFCKAAGPLVIVTVDVPREWEYARS